MSTSRSTSGSTKTIQQLKTEQLVISIVGMYVPNFRAVCNSMKEKVQLRYIDSDQSLKKFPLLTDYIICVGNKLSHAWYESAKTRSVIKRSSCLDGQSKSLRSLRHC